MRIAGIVRDSIVDGVGVRDVLFLQGCPHKCKGCHNPQTWAFNGGTYNTLLELVDAFKDSPNDITISGGEPLSQFCELCELMSVLNEYHGKRFWLYTGFTFEDVPMYMWEQLSKYVDVVIDGRFVEELKDTGLMFRGSSNQRLIDLKKTVIEQKVILWEESYGTNKTD